MSRHFQHWILWPAIVGLAAVTSTRHSAAQGPPSPGTANVPYVGCTSDGQLGPQPVPKQSKPTPRLPAPLASRLAYYAAIDNGVLAPRGWHCFSLYGSSGTTVLVTPGPIDRVGVFDTKFKIGGDAIELSYVLGGTSGRDEVAEVSSAFFPAAHDFAKRVAKLDKGMGFSIDLTGKAFRDDIIVDRTAKAVRLITPSRKQGWGTRDRLGAGQSPIHGLGVLVADDPASPDLVELNIRLPQKDQDLVPIIQSVTEANHGDALSSSPLRDPTDVAEGAHRRPH